MANKVDKNMIIQMNELYLTLKTYSAVAREVGLSPSTVKKYIQPGYVSCKDVVKKCVTIQDLPSLNECDHEKFLTANWSTLCQLSDEEYEEIKELWKEILI